MYIPQNGRIAIVDDQLKHAEPLMNVLSKRQLPYTYFSGDVNFLPELDNSFNDIRLLFLDINLIDDSEHENKVLKGRLIPVLKRVISKENHPYVIVYWSRHEHHKDLIEKDIFKDELKERSPIGFLSATKSDFFNHDGTSTDDFEERIKTLFENVNGLIKQSTVYSYLIQWENLVHKSADETLQNVFKPYNSIVDWHNNANYIFNNLGKAFLGKHYIDTEQKGKVIAGFNSFTSVFKDTLEHNSYNLKKVDAKDLVVQEDKVSANINSINLSLNIARDITDMSKSGCVLKIEEKEDLFKAILNKVISFFGLKKILLSQNPGIAENVLKKQTNKEHKRIKSEIKEAWINVIVVVTPICDYAQKNKINDRIVNGLLIPHKYLEYIESNSEAIYTLPIVFEVDSKEYVLVIDFRYFETCDIESEKVTPIFRLRQEILSEIQSKLSRHINRQGILILDS